MERWWWGAIAAGPVGLAVALAFGGCGARDEFLCESDDQCVAEDPGVCQPDGHCSFPAADCPSGQRYGEHGGSYSGQCVDPGGEATTTASIGSSTLTSGSASETAEPELTTTTATSVTTSGPADTGDETTHGEASTGTPVDPIDPDLVLWLELERSLRGEVLDSSSFMSHGVCMAPGCPELGRGQVGQAAAFDGDDDMIVVPPAPSLETTEALTIAAFIYVMQPPAGHQAVLARALGTSNDNSWELYFVSQVLHFGMVSGGRYAEVPLPWTFESLQWMHLAGTWDGDTMTLWINGEAVGSAAMPSIEFDDHPVLVGVDDDYESWAGHFHGTIDDVRVYRRALTADEIAALASG